MRWAVLLAVAGVAAFHLAYLLGGMGAGIVVLFLFAAAGAARLESARGAFWLGLGMGFFVYGVQLFFFARIFGVFAVSLWLILSVWVGFFVLSSHWARRRFGEWAMLAALPFLWMGFEYFRSELYALKFAWVTPGLAFGPGEMVHQVGTYGVGFVCAVLAAGAWAMRGWWRWAGLVVGVVVMGAVAKVPSLVLDHTDLPPGPIVVGIQMESEQPWKAIDWLEAAWKDSPFADLYILSEYTFPGAPPEDVCAWCKAHGKYVLAGGRRDVEGPGDKYYDTAFVVGPSGEIVFQQAKSVPIQFIPDGLPAREQALWNSPWGPIGVCVCYDMSYSRVTDRLVAMGAKLLIVPAMDAKNWGAYEHGLHARVGPVRAAEYGVPIVRVCSSGISQVIDRSGRVTSWTSFPGQGERVIGQVRMVGYPRLPLDRYVAPACAWLAVLYGGLEMALATVRRVREGTRKRAAGKVVESAAAG